jgi:site-specific DNA-cytosine methylase
VTINYLGVQTYAGGFDVGATQAGLTLVGRLEDKGGFGLHQCEANRHVLGDRWESQATDPTEWEPINAEIIVSNPPCSAFSSMTYGTITNSVDHRINQCMWNSIRYAGKVAPQVFIMESVQGAAVRGTPLMRQLRDELERLTGHSYHLYHVLQNNAALGGASLRRRYFMVLSRIPFGVELPDFGPPPTLFDSIGDLESMDYHTWGYQSYELPQSEWVKREVANEAGGTDGHITAKWDTPGMARIIDLLEGDTENMMIWPQDKCLVVALRRYYEAHGQLPPSWHFKRRSGVWADEALIAKQMEMGFTRPKRWRYDKPAFVIIGGAMYLVIHYNQNRMLTHRECARIMGFPDSWVIEPLQGLRGLEEGWGKGTSTHPARWIANWAKQAVLGQAGSFSGIPVTEHHRLERHGFCDRETVVDVSRVPKQQVLITDEAEAADVAA